MENKTANLRERPFPEQMLFENNVRNETADELSALVTSTCSGSSSSIINRKVKYFRGIPEFNMNNLSRFV